MCPIGIGYHTRVKTIDEWAFSSCTGLTSVIIGDGVEKIERNAFKNCSALQDVYYKGTESDWNSIAIEYLNNSLKEATRYYYSETEPALNEDGTDYDDNYWRYVDGAVVVWEME